MKQIINGVLNLIYPRCCPICHHILPEQRLLICPDCQAALRPIGEPRCKKCGRPVPEGEYCADCTQGRFFSEGRGGFVYDDRMRQSILRYKYGGRREYGAFFARALAAYTRRELARWQPDRIVPVPMYGRKQRRRGFNQAEDLAVRLSEDIQIPVAADWIRKEKNTRSQKRLDAKDRRKNLADAFCVTRPLQGERILVLDDVFTTGATIDAVAECLLLHGAGKVFFLTIAIGVISDF